MGEAQTLLSEHEVRIDRLVILSPSSLPKTSSGKKQRQRTRQLLKEGSLAVLWDSILNATELILSDAPRENIPMILPQEIIQQIEDLRSYMSGININLADERRSFPADFLFELGRFGFLNLKIPMEFGGRELSNSVFCQLAEEFGNIDISMAAILGIHNTIGSLPIVYSKSFERRKEVLTEVANGAITAFALTESGAGSNPRAITCRVNNRDKRLILNGEKIWVGNAAFATFIVVIAKEFDATGKDLGASAFLLDRRRHNFIVEAEQLTLGVKAMPQSRLTFLDVLLTEKDRLTRPGDGFSVAFQAMEFARFGLAAVSIGAMKHAYTIVNKFAENRQIWTGSLSQNKYFKRQMFQANLKIKSLRCLVEATANYADKTSSIPQILSLTCKILAGEWGMDVADSCLQLCGGRGYTETFGLARIWRDLRLMRIFEGPTETVAYQLGAIIIRQPSAVCEILKRLDPEADVNAFFETTIQNWLTKFGSNISLEIMNIYVGLFAAEYISYSLAEGRVLIKDFQFNRMIELRCEHYELEIRQSLLEVNIDTSSSAEIKNLRLYNEQNLFDPWAGSFTVIEKYGQTIKTDRLSHRSLELNINSSPKADRVFNRKSSEPLAASNIRVQIETWLKRHTKSGTVDYSKSISEYGVDSLLAYELLCFLEEELGVILPEATILERPSLNELTEIVLRHSLAGEPQKEKSANVSIKGSNESEG